MKHAVLLSLPVSEACSVALEVAVPTPPPPPLPPLAELRAVPVEVALACAVGEPVGVEEREKGALALPPRTVTVPVLLNLTVALVLPVRLSDTLAEAVSVAAAEGLASPAVALMLCVPPTAPLSEGTAVTEGSGRVAEAENEAGVLKEAEAEGEAGAEGEGMRLWLCAEEGEAGAVEEGLPLGVLQGDGEVDEDTKRDGDERSVVEGQVEAVEECDGEGEAVASKVEEAVSVRAATVTVAVPLPSATVPELHCVALALTQAALEGDREPLGMVVELALPRRAESEGRPEAVLTKLLVVRVEAL